MIRNFLTYSGHIALKVDSTSFQPKLFLLCLMQHLKEHHAIDLTQKDLQVTFRGGDPTQGFFVNRWGRLFNINFAELQLEHAPNGTWRINYNYSAARNFWAMFLVPIGLIFSSLLLPLDSAAPIIGGAALFLIMTLIILILSKHRFLQLLRDAQESYEKTPLQTTATPARSRGRSKARKTMKRR